MSENHSSKATESLNVRGFLRHLVARRVSESICSKSRIAIYYIISYKRVALAPLRGGLATLRKENCVFPLHVLSKRS